MFVRDFAVVLVFVAVIMFVMIVGVFVVLGFLLAFLIDPSVSLIQAHLKLGVRI